MIIQLTEGDNRYFVHKTQQVYGTIEEAIKDHMQAEGYFPNVWNVSDHGNSHLVVMSHQRIRRQAKQKLLTQEDLGRLPALGTTDGQGYEALAQVKFFNPGGVGTWYATEYDPATRTFFGLADLGDPELGYFSLDELEQAKGNWGLGIERDMYFSPTALKALMP